MAKGKRGYKRSLGLKRKALSVAKKLEIIDFAEKNSRMKQAEIAGYFDLPKQTLSSILLKKDVIRLAAGVGGSNLTDKGPNFQNKKKMRANNYEDVDAALIMWFREHYGKLDVRIDNMLLLEKAKYFACEFGYDSTISQTWIDRWKKRWNIAIAGIGKMLKSKEAGVVDTTEEKSRNTTVTEILNKFDPEDVYNCDETDLFWKMLPENSLGFVGEHVREKEPKERITLLIGSNMTGMDKMPLFVIGKSAKPQAFKNLKKIPVKYVANKNAWMKSDIFEAEMREFDRNMKKQDRKVAMIVDNCRAHPNIGNLENVTLYFLPPNITSVTQPMDSGIIKNFKLHYRKILSLHRLQAAEANTEFTWNLLDSLFACKSAWEMVSCATIVNCWKHAGFVIEENELTETDSDGEVEYQNIWDRLGQFLDLPSAENFLNVDEIPQTGQIAMSDNDILAVIQDKNTGSVDEEEDEAPVLPTPTIKAALEAVDVLRRFVMSTEVQEIDELLMYTNKLEGHICAESGNKSIQTKMN